MPPIRVVIADDHAAVRKSLRMLLECDPDLELAGEAADGQEAIRAVHRLNPDFLLLDIKMPLMTGLEVLQYLRNEKTQVRVIMVTNHSEGLYVEAALRLGANGFVAKSSGPDTLLAAIRAVLAGDTYVDPEIGA